MVCFQNIFGLLSIFFNTFWEVGQLYSTRRQLMGTYSYMRQAVLSDRNCQFVLALRFILLIASLLSQAVNLSILKQISMLIWINLLAYFPLFSLFSGQQVKLSGQYGLESLDKIDFEQNLSNFVYLQLDSSNIICLSVVICFSEKFKSLSSSLSKHQIRFNTILPVQNLNWQ